MSIFWSFWVLALSSTGAFFVEVDGILWGFRNPFGITLTQIIHFFFQVQKLQFVTGLPVWQQHTKIDASLFNVNIFLCPSDINLLIMHYFTAEHPPADRWWKKTATLVFQCRFIISYIIMLMGSSNMSGGFLRSEDIQIRIKLLQL